MEFMSAKKRIQSKIKCQSLEKFWLYVLVYSDAKDWGYYDAWHNITTKLFRRPLYMITFYAVIS